jgi:glycosyltransferase involved in cell wall biosynthesis
LESIKSQAHVDIELCVIDSTSTDNSLKITQEYFPDALVRKIPKTDFNHGETRNTLVQMATSEYIFFLTQDVILADRYLLRSLVTEVKNEGVALAFCRHIPYPNHNEFVKRDINGTFSSFRVIFSTPSGLVDHENDQLRLAFSSNNASMYKKSLLSKYPFEMIVYGEDQLWTKMMLKKGYLLMTNEKSI